MVEPSLTSDIISQITDKPAPQRLRIVSESAKPSQRTARTVLQHLLRKVSLRVNPDFLLFNDGQQQGEKGVRTEILDTSKQMYFRLVKAYNSVCDQLRQQNEVDCSPMLQHVERTVDILKHDERILMGMAQAPLSYIERMAEKIDYPEVVYYGINTMIYALQIANSLGFPVDKINYLGMAALLQNVGLLGNDATETGARFNDVIEKLKSSTEQSGEFLQRIRIEGFHHESLEAIIDIIKSRETVLDQTSLHDTLQQYAMVIHICNVFVYLTHERNSDRVVSPTDAMKIMRSEMKDFFHPDVIKLFFNKLSIYPIGTFVKLSSSETAKIVDINENYLMRPIVLVVLGGDKEVKLNKQRIDLRKNPNIYIKKSIVDDELTERFIDYF